MVTKFIYKCQLRGSLTNVYLTDLAVVRELLDDGEVVSCRRWMGVLEK